MMRRYHHLILLCSLIFCIVGCSGSGYGTVHHQQDVSAASDPPSSFRPRKLIVGGHDAVKGRYPYFVSLDYNNGVVLSGALIAPDFVLTAGHVLENDNDRVTVRVGTYQLSPRDKDPSVDDNSEVVAMDGTPILHPFFARFRPESFRYDYLLFHLQTNSSHPPPHTPVRLNRNASVPAVDEELTLMGLGWTTPAYPSPADTLQVAHHVVALSNAACESAHDPDRVDVSYAGCIDESMLCTSARGWPDHLDENSTTIQDGCAWDSGAPMIIPDPQGDPSRDVLVGLGSWGVGCGDPFFPGVQARVSTAAAWIDATVCRLSIDPPKDFGCQHEPEHSNRNSSDEAPVAATPNRAAPVSVPTVSAAPATASPVSTKPPPVHTASPVSEAPIRTPSFVPTSVLLTCIAVALGIAVVVFLALNYWYVGWSPPENNEPLLPDETAAMYGSTDYY